MDFYNSINDLTEEDLKEVLLFKIKTAIYQTQDTKKRFIGVDCGINPNVNFYGEIKSDSQSMWHGFIPEDVKIIYSFVPDEKGFTINNGCYYYIDDYDYLFDFARFIQNKNIKTDIEFLTYVYQFIDNYFNILKSNSIHRKEMHRPLIDSKGRNIESVYGHHFYNFKGSNNAECSEYSAMAENILSIFDYNTFFFSGSVNTPYGKGGHAFNLTIIDNIPCILDFTIPVEVYKMSQERITYSPFVGIIDDFSNNDFFKHVTEFIPYDFPDFFYLDTDTYLTQISTGEERNYVIGNVEYFNEKSNKLSK